MKNTQDEIYDTRSIAKGIIITNEDVEKAMTESSNKEDLLLNICKNIMEEILAMNIIEKKYSDIFTDQFIETHKINIYNLVK